MQAHCARPPCSTLVNCRGTDLNSLSHPQQVQGVHRSCCAARALAAEPNIKQWVRCLCLCLALIVCSRKRSVHGGDMTRMRKLQPHAGCQPVQLPCTCSTAADKATGKQPHVRACLPLQVCLRLVDSPPGIAVAKHRLQLAATAAAIFCRAAQYLSLCWGSRV